MSDGDDDIEVEPVDTSILDETVEVTFRGSPDAIMELGNAIDLALDTIASTGLLDHPGWAAVAAVLSPTMDDFAEQFQTDELLDMPDGIKEVDVESLEDALEVEVRWVDREDANE